MKQESGQWSDPCPQTAQISTQTKQDSAIRKLRSSAVCLVRRNLWLASFLVPILLLANPARGNYPTGDLNKDSEVDLLDLKVLAEHWLTAGSLADLDGDGRIDMSDFALLADSWRTKATPLVINEFMAVNTSEPPLAAGELLDEDGSSCDWIEIYNSTPTAVNIEGWYLTDDADNLKKWRFAALEIGPRGFLVLFASGKDRDDPDGQLHTDFKISGQAGFLALVMPDGKTMAQAYQYPQQFSDVSYGLAQESSSTSATRVLVPEYVDAKALIPQDGSLELSWIEPDFEDADWLKGKTGVGYEASSGYEGYIALDVRAQMYNKNSTCYIRIPFEVEDLANLSGLRLQMKYDDGFAAYLNGYLIASANAPAPDGLTWNSGATASHDDSQAVNFVDFPIPDHCIEYLRIGQNLLAIHGLNRGASGSDLLILPKLTVEKAGPVDFSPAMQGYFFSPTPGKTNGPIVADVGPSVRHVTENPPAPASGEDLIITAEVQETLRPISGVRLVCRVNFASSNRWLPSDGLPMLDDGTGADAVANDGIYTAVVPSVAYGPGDMVRWYVIATDTEGIATREPRFLFPADSPEYFGTVVKDPYIRTRLPLIQWFVEDVAASESDSGARGAVYSLGEFYDNVVIHRRGGSTADMPKKHFKFRFNHGCKFKFDARLQRVNEFNLNSTYSDKAYLRQNLAFNAYDWCGCPGSISFPMCAYRNGEFYGVQVFIEEPEEELLEREGSDPDGALYKMYNTFNAGGSAEKKTRRWEGRSDLDNFCNRINSSFAAEKHNNIFDYVNLPLTLDYLVATVLVHQNDHPHKNHYLYCDSDGSGEWFFLPWDHDLTWGSNWTGSSFHDYIYADDDQVPGKPTDVKPSHPFIGKQDCKEWNFHWNRLIDALLNDPTVREMFNRRLRTIMDEFLKPPGTSYSDLFVENRIDELVAQMVPDVARDYVKWANPWPWGGQGGYPSDQSFQYAINVIKNDYLAVRRYHLFVRHNVDNVAGYDIPGSYSAALPNAQPPDAAIDFGSYDYNPVSGNQDEEYVELINPNGYAVDISGWQLTGGVAHEFLPGSVIVAGGRLYVSPNVAAFRKRASSPTGGQGRFVQGNYKGHLSSWGETINLLNKQGGLVSSMSYPGSPSDQQRFLRITEIMYNPAEGGAFDNEEYEYIELKNIGAVPLSLNGVKFTDGILFVFPNISLPANGYVLVGKNRAAFTSRHAVPDGVQVLGPYAGWLANSGEGIKLEDSTNSTILQFTFEDAWRKITDGGGFSLTVVDAANPDLDSWGEKDSWRASAFYGGSPGWDDTGIIPEPGSVVINEVLAHSHAEAADWVELHNMTAEAINIGGWFLSDDGNDLTKYEIADDTVIAANAYLVFYEDHHFGNPADPNCHRVFALSENGDQVYLSSAQDGVLTGYQEMEDFGASETGVSFGRYYKGSTDNYNFVAMSENTPGSANAYPQVGPIVINEIMYNPASGDQNEEYIELLNISSEPVDLYRYDKSEPWRFTDGIEFVFPSDPVVTIPAGGYLLVVKDLDAFAARYGSMPAGAVVLGPYEGQLKNGGEKLELSMPGDVDAFGQRYYIRVDRVNFSDGSHPEDQPGGVDSWPVAADGGGMSLSRKVASDYGNDVANWNAASPSPGMK